MWLNYHTTGRHLPPLSSVLYGIISQRSSVLAAQLLLREKSGALRVGTDSNIPSLPAGSMVFIWWKLKMSYHTAYPNCDSQAVVYHLFLSSFICALTTAFTWLSKFCRCNSLVFLPILGTLLVQGFIFERGPTIFKIFKEHNLYRFVQIKVHWKTFHPFYPPPFSPLVCPPYRI